MANTVTQYKSFANNMTDPLRAFKFHVIINSPLVTSSNPNTQVALGFMSVSGLGVQTDIISYRQGGYNTTALPLDARILTTSGWKPNGEIEIGDRVIDPYGQDSKVIGIYPAGTKDCYRVTLGDGSSEVACYGHLWEVQVRDTNNRKHTEVVSTLRMKELVEKKGYQVLLPKISPVQFEPSPELPLHPYLLGILLAEGSLSEESLHFASNDTEVVERVRELLPAGHEIKSYGVKHKIAVGNKGPGARNKPGRNKILTALADLGLRGTHSHDKFIPEIYQRAEISDRVELLRGIMDGDGSIKADGNIRYASASQALTRGVQELINSIGGRARMTQRPASYTYKGEKRQGRDAYWISGVLGLEVNPFHLSRKAERFKVSTKGDAQGRRVRSVEYDSTQEVQCLEVSADSHLFISGEYVPSHNTQKMPGQSDFGPVVLQKGVILGDANLIDWLTATFDVQQGTGNWDNSTDFRANVDILVLEHPVTTPTAAVKAAFRIYNAWPTQVSFNDFDAANNMFMVTQMTLAHEGWQVNFASGVGPNSTAATPGT